jgi:hypothetical protein
MKVSNAPHKLQGRGALQTCMGDIGRWCQPQHNPLAAPCQLHAVVRPRKRDLQQLNLALRGYAPLRSKVVLMTARPWSIIAAILGESS